MIKAFRLDNKGAHSRNESFAFPFARSFVRRPFSLSKKKHGEQRGRRQQRQREQRRPFNSFRRKINKWQFNPVIDYPGYLIKVINKHYHFTKYTPVLCNALAILCVCRKRALAAHSARSLLIHCYAWPLSKMCFCYAALVFVFGPYEISRVGSRDRE